MHHYEDPYKSHHQSQSLTHNGDTELILLLISLTESRRETTVQVQLDK